VSGISAPLGWYDSRNSVPIPTLPAAAGIVCSAFRRSALRRRLLAHNARALGDASLSHTSVLVSVYDNNATSTLLPDTTPTIADLVIAGDVLVSFLLPRLHASLPPDTPGLAEAAVSIVNLNDNSGHNIQDSASALVPVIGGSVGGGVAVLGLVAALLTLQARRMRQRTQASLLLSSNGAPQAAAAAASGKKDGWVEGENPLHSGGAGKA